MTSVLVTEGLEGMRNEEIALRLKALVEKGVGLRSTSNSGDLPWDTFSEWRAQSLSLLSMVLGPGHTYTTSFEAQVLMPRTHYAKSGVGILRAAMEDAELGLLGSVRELVAAEIFSDFLEMAKHLHEAGYRSPAASLAGAVLEDGLRQIAERNDVKVRTGDDMSALNQRIADRNIYNRLKQKQVQVWIDVRNLADHGHFEDLKDEDVRALLTGVEGFLAEHL
jgi:hypothetical protein